MHVYMADAGFLFYLSSSMLILINVNEIMKDSNGELNKQNKRRNKKWRRTAHYRTLFFVPVFYFGDCVYICVMLINTLKWMGYQTAVKCPKQSIIWLKHSNIVLQHLETYNTKKNITEFDIIKILLLFFPFPFFLSFSLYILK